MNTHAERYTHTKFRALFYTPVVGHSLSFCTPPLKVQPCVTTGGMNEVAMDANNVPEF